MLASRLARSNIVRASRVALTRAAPAAQQQQRALSSAATSSHQGESNSTGRRALTVAAAAAAAFAGATLLVNKLNADEVNAATSVAGVENTPSERSFIALKPDAIQRGLIADIVGRLERKGFKLVAMKLLTPSKELVEKHYEDLKDRPFYPGLVAYMAQGPVLAMVWQGPGVVKTVRQMLGATNPAQAPSGSIRSDFFLVTGRNGIHASDAHASAEAEIALWFKPSELVDWKRDADQWILSAN
ncbi:nucleoside diphosphate kinase B [Capsaspora owczarzaki ATCC 30864]|uniref:nucleoside-diphosphate kinase n=1 Tax=Capsaspora owczarzaki (strain ATCC 30864) TaxID=595528 RepID=A0A0D2WKF1_CAPO3|nr:nucleoside diphosphate kinase B [Capsaspora owczarzaki ATCC 30864]KJE90053.1 nucleoside diphosphate kinase B [Capsaspora owczarzaki ATCC 30864]|eukprot:XP_004349949.1 nucleoside diphosphate kinase B [Capsaspora owczarzaki ATCC 30864]